MSPILATWKRLIETQTCKALVLTSCCDHLFHGCPSWSASTGYYFLCGQDTWSCLHEANTSCTSVILFQDLFIPRDYNSINNQWYKFRLRYQLWKELVSPLIFQVLYLEELLTVYPNNQSSLPDGENYTNRKDCKNLIINFGRSY